MLTCREVSELVSQGFERRLSLRERSALRLHLLICRGCTRAGRQMAFLHAAAGQYARRGIHAVQRLTLRPQARERIRQALLREA